MAAPPRPHHHGQGMGEGEEHAFDRQEERETSYGSPGEREIDDCTPGTSHVVPSSKGDDMIEEPKSGMEFNSFEDLFSYYKQYAKKCGFGVMTQRSERSEDQSVRYVTIGCARGGKARIKTSNVANPRPTGKTDCKARINALRVDGKMQLTTVNNSHNHVISPQKSRFYRCNREVSETVKRVLDTNDLAGIRLNKSYGSLVVGAGGFENLPFLEKDCRNYIEKARHLRLGAGGAGALRDYFLRMQYKNHGFFALMDLDDDGRLKNVFWADPRSRAAYKYFGDVVTFDTTYLTNRYGMPFAPFVGVNHHGQSILLGAGLISSEDTETFIWLFQTWLQCMDGVAPKAIITDQDRAMKNAIAIVFPETRHRFCLWHILKKAPEKLGAYAAYKSGLKTELMKCVYDTQTIEEFEKCWSVFINTYHLHENVWLKSLYLERAHWVPIFLRDHFWAGMSTTQRSESMNAFFDGYVHSKTNLKEFVDQFDNALKRKIENENQAEFLSFSGTIPCVSRSPIEKKFQVLYTNAKFKEVQQQVIGVLDLDPSLQTMDGVMKSYLVEDEVRIHEFTKQVTYFVDFNVDDCNANCSCGLFQMRGILCRHILAVFKTNGVKSLPDRYILDRWRKDIKRRYTLIRSSYDAQDERPNGNRQSILLNMCYEMIDYAVESDNFFEDAKKRIHEMTGLYRQNHRPNSSGQTVSEPGVTILDGAVVGSSQQVKSPLVVRGKGRPPSLRRASRMETEMRKIKAKQKKAQVGGKRKQRDDNHTVAMGTYRNLFGPSEADITNDGQFTVMDSSGTTQSVQPMFFGSQESVHPMVGSQESIFYDWMTHNQSSLGGDGSGALM
ncbi:protein FAR1-RELATED SEQUENCE 5-like isoform X2 [Carya illinoinensis]|uniref:protein FAR1-RELATED SEQUENCE 5-like isoform X2 n=1 Tax=Carya illinoinensis TaxID=32201 RepID=UPI001C71C3BF|nr:protein FAR1-RELATED SEQUENCE 5-like isoform X2 [Carya illinoinensis]XP_042955113.1 protein FAR1-RELATED SEQUENCE 5-like isoform X2 [Carya illinoinensis]XP_042959237.1 protein FAR1-RELATED SEQUENCE 5-like isoform X2 [Carya illinoinensis]XP_042975255.1 protein FAR1-RELATED SEQUENCE 5-like isoform X2 [Carya illinoinensis]XP_042978503.1 protein FAR1-RELATED SEQUENCE 5-like isoform X2 [Carya illinoinensis]